MQRSKEPIFELRLSIERTSNGRYGVSMDCNGDGLARDTFARTFACERQAVLAVHRFLSAMAEARL